MYYKKKIAIFSGNRAEYGLLNPIIRSISKNKKLDYKLIISGAHLDKKFGETIKEIKLDGFKIYSTIKINLDEKKSECSVPVAIGNGIIKISKVLKKIRPDYLLVYADRFEGFAAVIAGTQMGIPTIHVEGGDVTNGGAFDDNVRHAMTKLSHIHITTNNNAKNRILKMGEEKWRVKNFGFSAIDLIKEKNYANQEELEKKYKIQINRPIVIFTQHSITSQYKNSGDELKESLKALKLLNIDGVQVIATFPNNDIGSKKIIELINKINNKNIKVYKSIGRYDYHGFLSLARFKNFKIACVGNSSSGIKETTVFSCPAVNIGNRQLGRLRGKNVLDAKNNCKDIYKKTNIALFSKKFRKICLKAKNPYGGGSCGKKISNFIAKINYNKKKIIIKKMTIK
jgi:UDP-hydrolysing UDP-N-acetyl-D-glucosamine 2-epimerase